MCILVEKFDIAFGDTVECGALVNCILKRTTGMMKATKIHKTNLLINLMVMTKKMKIILKAMFCNIQNNRRSLHKFKFDE